MKKVVTLLVIAATAACATYRRGKGTLAATASESFYDVYANEVYATPDKVGLKADVYVPRQDKPPFGYPVVVLIHGGGWTNGSKEQMIPIAERLATAGYAVMNISYRFAPKYVWPAQLEDCQAALAWLAKNATRFNLDVNNAATFGYSAGAHLALMTAYTPNTSGIKFRAAVDGAGPVDFSDFPDSPLVRQLMGDSIERIAESYFKASPYNFISKSSPATFVYYGENDWIVNANQNRKLLKKLQDYGIAHDSYEAYFGHIATFLFDEKETGLAIKFLDRVMKKAER